MTTDRLTPTQKGERIITLDVIRGFALLGILLVNMQFFSSPKLFMIISDVRLFDSTLSQAADWIITIFATGKFYTTFSFLFGLGFFLFMERVRARELPVGKVYSRRLTFLLVLGGIHLFFMWSGDILFNYALAGFLLLLFRNSSIETVKKWAKGLFIGVLILMALLSFLNSVAMEMLADQPEFVNYETLTYEAVEVFQTGSFAEITAFRMANEIPIIIPNLFITVPMVLAIFLIGLYVGKKGVLRDISGHLSWIRAIWKKSLIYTVVLTAFHAILSSELVTVPFFMHESAVEVLALTSGLAGSFFYMSSLTLLCHHDTWKNRVRSLAPVGQMALTNYMIQTVVALLIFYGYGLGMFGQVPPEIGILITVAIFIFQIFLSKMIMTRYNYGPLERVWRMFTYKGVS